MMTLKRRGIDAIVRGLITGAITASVFALSSPATAQIPPDSILTLSEHENGFNGIWRFDGDKGTGNWDSHGRPPSQAQLTLQKFDGHCLEIHREDATGGTMGMVADYKGCVVAGQHIEGTAVWKVQLGKEVPGKWNADFEIITASEAEKRGLTAFNSHNGVEARRWLEFAASRGDVYAQLRLGILLRDGTGGPKDPVRARSLFEQGDRGGRGDSAFYLGQMMESGEGGPADNDGAIKMYERSVSAHFGPAEARLLLIHEMTYTPGSVGNGPNWLSDTHEMEDGATTIKSLSTQIVEGGSRFVLSTQCVAGGIGAATNVSFSLWLLTDQNTHLHLTNVKYRRQGASGNAATAPSSEHYRPDRWTLIRLPADTDEALQQFADQANWNNYVNSLSFALGMDGSFALGLQGSSVPADQAAAAAHVIAAQRMLWLYQLLFREKEAGAGTGDRDIMLVEVHYAPDGPRDDPRAQTQRILKFDLTDMDQKRHDFLVDQCQMSDPFADAAVRQEQPDP